MDIGKIDSLQSVLSTASLSSPNTKGVAQSKGFLDVLKDSLDQVSQTQKQSEAITKQYMLDQNGVTLEETMVASQKANIAFQMTLQVRNKVIAAYQEIMNMQI